MTKISEVVISMPQAVPVVVKETVLPGIHVFYDEDMGGWEIRLAGETRITELEEEDLKKWCALIADVLELAKATWETESKPCG